MSSSLMKCVAATRWTTREVPLSSETARRLEQRAADEGANPEAIFVGAMMALLARYARRDDVSLMVQLQGRTEVLRAALGGDPDVPDLVRRASSAMSVASALDGPCPKHFVPGSVANLAVLVTFGGLDLSGHADLVLRVTPESADLHARVECFEGRGLSRVAEHLRALLAGVAGTSGPVSAIPIVLGEERGWVLECSNVGSVQLDEALPSVVERFESQVRATPAATAVAGGDRHLTYRQLDEAANTLCDRLRARGVSSEVPVGVYLERGADAVIALLGILKAGGTYVPIDTGFPAGRVEAIVACSSPRIIVTRCALQWAIPAQASGRMLMVDDVDAGVPTSHVTAPRPRVRPDDAAYTFFTSGSTGQPKGVVVDHRALANYARAALDAYRVRAGDRVLQAASLGFDLSLEEIIVTLTCGATLVVRSAHPIESVQAFLRDCEERRLTVLSITSALWHELTMRLADGSVGLPPLLRLVILGADVARSDVFALWQQATAGRVRLVNSYGLTETTIVATVWEATAQSLEGDGRAVPIGRPLRNVSAYVLDPTSELVPVGVAGEICVGGLAVARGYLGDDALTASRFIADPFLPGARMYRTGDHGILRASGELQFIGRVDHRMKVNGVRVELGEIEARLREFPGVIEAVVVARTTQAGETELEAHAMVGSADASPASLRAHLERLLPLSIVPARIDLVDRFPLTTAGKIDRRALAAQTSSVRCADFVAPQSTLEKLVADTTAEVLCAARVGMSDDFVSLGGSSLSAVRAASLLQHRLGRPVRAHVFLESATLGGVCVALESNPEEGLESAALLRQLRRDAILDPVIASRSLATGPAPLSAVLLTGATGYYGTFVLFDLVRETRAHVTCLVRAQTRELARARVLEALERRGCPVEPSVLASRLTVECGDVARPDLGLSPTTFRGLCESIDAIFHVAAHVNLLLPYKSLRASNVLAVESVLRFATTGRPKTLHHVSTVEVLADTDPLEADALTERPTASSPALLDSGYGQSKWVAEKLVEAARQRGVRAYVHRPGRLMGHSSTGAFNSDDLLVQLIEACGLVGAAPMLDVVVDMTPVDYASRMLIRLAQKEPEREVFHLVHPEPPAWSSLLATIIDLDYPLHIVPLAQWRSRLAECSTPNGGPRFTQYLSSLSREEMEGSIRGGYESRATRDALGQDVPCPPIDAKLVETYLQALVKEGRFAIGRSCLGAMHGAARIGSSRAPASLDRRPESDPH